MNVTVSFGILVLALAVYATIWFELARLVKRIDVIDVAWGLGFIYVALILLFSQSPMPAAARAAAILASIWGIRLSLHIGKRNAHKPEDPRYTVYRQKWGAQFWPYTYIKIYLVQAACILLISTPLVAIETSPRHVWSWLIWLGFAVWAAGILFESVADAQLKRFLNGRKDHGVMQHGLWRYSRHPNYFGEIVTWTGAGLVAGGLGHWWGLIGPVVIAFLITQISGIPPVEKRYARDHAYQVYARKTSLLIPWPPRRD